VEFYKGNDCRGRSDNPRLRAALREHRLPDRNSAGAHPDAKAGPHKAREALRGEVIRRKHARHDRRQAPRRRLWRIPAAGQVQCRRRDRDKARHKD
jgi:hypothetical protein